MNLCAVVSSIVMAALSPGGVETTSDGVLGSEQRDAPIRIVVSQKMPGGGRLPFKEKARILLQAIGVRVQEHRGSDRRLLELAVSATGESEASYYSDGRARHTSGTATGELVVADVGGGTRTVLFRDTFSLHSKPAYQVRVENGYDPQRRPNAEAVDGVVSVFAEKLTVAIARLYGLQRWTEVLDDAKRSKQLRAADLEDDVLDGFAAAGQKQAVGPLVRHFTRRLLEGEYISDRDVRVLNAADPTGWRTTEAAAAAVRQLGEAARTASGKAGKWRWKASVFGLEAIAGESALAELRSLPAPEDESARLDLAKALLSCGLQPAGSTEAARWLRCGDAEDAIKRITPLARSTNEYVRQQVAFLLKAMTQQRRLADDQLPLAVLLELALDAKRAVADLAFETLGVRAGDSVHLHDSVPRYLASHLGFDGLKPHAEANDAPGWIVEALGRTGDSRAFPILLAKLTAGPTTTFGPRQAAIGLASLDPRWRERPEVLATSERLGAQLSATASPEGRQSLADTLAALRTPPAIEALYRMLVRLGKSAPERVSRDYRLSSAVKDALAALKDAKDWRAYPLICRFYGNGDYLSTLELAGYVREATGNSAHSRRECEQARAPQP